MAAAPLYIPSRPLASIAGSRVYPGGLAVTCPAHDACQPYASNDRYSLDHSVVRTQGRRADTVSAAT